MAYFNEVLAFAQAAAVSKDVDGLIKVAADSVVPADIVFMHNLIDGNIYTGEGIIKIAEDMGEPILGVAADVYEYVKEAGDDYDEKLAIAALEEAGLTLEDYAQVEYLLDKQAEEAAGGEIVADEEVWEKVASAYEFLASQEIDPVSAMEFAENYAVADSDGEKEAVASEYDGLDEESFDKIAEAFNYLSDIDGVPLSDLMYEIDKEAGYATDLVRRVGEHTPGTVLAKGLTTSFKDMYTGVKKTGKGLWGSYKNAVMGKGIDSAKKNIKIIEPEIEKAEAAYQKARDIAKNGKPSDNYSVAVKKSMKRAAKRGKFHGLQEERVPTVKDARKHLSGMKKNLRKEKRRLGVARASQAAAIGIPVAAGAYGVHKALND
jgi:hypothetical protein